MSDDSLKFQQQRAREEREGELVRARAVELYLRPISGKFDIKHLKEVHAHLFQDLPHHKPGIVRADSDGWNKARALEGQAPSHVVSYVHKGVAKRIETVLQEFGGPDALRNLDLENAARRLSKLYGDLDHAHGFYEGNSRTLREFTRQLASAAGHELNWTKTAVNAEQRNALYVARDVAVLERAFPGLTPERAMQTDSRAEYEASWHLEKLKKLQGEKSLEAIVRENMVPGRTREQEQTEDRKPRQGVGRGRTRTRSRTEDN